jgi:hypothetical protein
MQGARFYIGIHSPDISGMLDRAYLMWSHRLRRLGALHRRHRGRKPLKASDQLGGGMRSVVAVGKTAPLATSVVMGVSFFIDGGA